MKRYPISIIALAIIVVINLFQYKFTRFLVGFTGKSFVSYLMFGLTLAFFVVMLIKAVVDRKQAKIVIIIYSAGIFFYFLLSKPVLEFQIKLFTLFILGLIIAFESKKATSYAPLMLLLVCPVLVELANNLSVGSTFFLLNVWLFVIVIMAGYVAAKTGFGH